MDTIPVKITTKKWLPRKYFNLLQRKYGLSYSRLSDGTNVYTGSIKKKNITL